MAEQEAGGAAQEVEAMREAEVAVSAARVGLLGGKCLCSCRLGSREHRSRRCTTRPTNRPTAQLHSQPSKDAGQESLGRHGWEAARELAAERVRKGLSEVSESVAAGAVRAEATAMETAVAIQSGQESTLSSPTASRAYYRTHGRSGRSTQQAAQS